MPLLGFDVPKFQVDNLFDSFDADGSGTIEYDERRKVLQSASTSPSKSPEMRKKSSASPEKQKAMAEKAKALARVQEKSDRAKQPHRAHAEVALAVDGGGGTPMPSEAGSPVAPRPPPARPSANPTPINGLSPAPRPAPRRAAPSRPAPSRASGGAEAEGVGAAEEVIGHQIHEFSKAGAPLTSPRSTRQAARDRLSTRRRKVVARFSRRCEPPPAGGARAL